jgi:predicted thioesterase
MLKLEVTEISHSFLSTKYIAITNPAIANTISNPGIPWIGVGVSVGVTVGVTVSVGVAVGVTVTVSVGVGVTGVTGDGVGASVTVGDGEGAPPPP